MDFKKYGFTKLWGTWWERNLWHRPNSFRHALTHMLIGYWHDGWVSVRGKFHGDSGYDKLFEGYIRKQEDFDTVMRLILDDENYGLTDS